METNVKIFLILLLVMISIAPIASAESLSIRTSQSTYNYGDYLSIIISAPKVTGKTATMYITDSQGTKSSPIPILMKNQTTTITAPNPFNSEVFKPGKYQIQVDYSNATSSTSFQLIDDGRPTLPFGSTIIVPKWIDGSITDKIFFKFLAEKSVIKTPDKMSDKTMIPYWYKTNAKWWLEKKISDSEFIKGLQYLVDQKIVRP